MKRALIFNPYWDTLGGGEKYAATIAAALAELQYLVDIVWHDKSLLPKLEERFNIPLNATIIPSLKKPIGFHYDLVFWVSDGSVPWLWGKKNWLHFQVPFMHVNGRKWINSWKFKLINTIVCNSAFTKAIIDAEYGVNSEILYPPVKAFISQKKENLILSVGRFDNLLHSKRQDILIDSFLHLNPEDWELYLVGGVLHGQETLATLKAKTNDPRVHFVVNPSYSTLRALYGKASIYWHAAGYGQDLSLNPERAEHFGITTVEAMSASAVPVVFGGGGQKEIVENGKNGFIWDKPEDLISITQKLIETPQLRQRIGEDAKERSYLFSEERFRHELKKLLM